MRTFTVGLDDVVDPHGNMQGHDSRRLYCGRWGIAMDQYMDMGKVAVEGSSTDSQAYGQLNKMLDDANTGTLDANGFEITVIDEEGNVGDHGSQVPFAVTTMTYTALQCELDPYKVCRP